VRIIIDFLLLLCHFLAFSRKNNLHLAKPGASIENRFLKKDPSRIIDSSRRFLCARQFFQELCKILESIEIIVII